ncbi:LOW QUALITY PROTEIN: alpha-1,3/1,6-mannosyltransferase ALG2-like [Homalodisca vitripennis]|uniref:LOW QUALITY PROTEIN: alpha-1,3/1,6-mannosyltransferase ALG2-like n=1 Tax=Homalodisca vitripennis TaxID=197043 RepID=UPI001EEBE9CC|nr:LOW QUALITY PROTEIN: alpha-1,3/1,6-mannosyltransferase ALG2-like [Homalodisca vitripennis]
MPKNILFLHPDLGIGGAERLVVDAALALIAKGHVVNFVTTHHDLSHCFEETKNGSFPVTVVGDWIPRNIFGKFYALCAYLKMIYAAFYIICFGPIQPDLIFCDIVSACIPVFWLSRCRVIYYCHFPDQLLSKPGSKLKSLYRAPLNWLEEITTASADIILVNSEFTRNVFKDTFKSIQKTPAILYPSINTDFFKRDCSSSLKDILGDDFESDRFIFLSINRYERKKNILLAITALSLLKTKLSEKDWDRVYLIIAGGYDNRVIENLEYYEELKEKSIKYEVQNKVYFLKSPSDDDKLYLLQQCDCLLYTPSNEHFGIVPLEAMYSQKAVIAVNNGGPVETVVDGETGFLCEASEESFSSAMAVCVKDINVTRSLGMAGRKRFEEKFSFAAFQNNLNEIVQNITPLE